MNAQILCSISLVLSPISFAKTIVFESGNQRVTLLELYSSEGCSSCPPADKQLAKLRKHKKLFQSFVPIEFHVDYWNDLGWIDPFSNQQFSKRQKEYAKLWSNKTVYTPGFVANGKEHPLWTPLPTGKDSAQPGNLSVTSSDGKVFTIQFKPKANNVRGPLEINATLLGNGLKTKVPSGENAGETLKHEFVVLKHQLKRVSKTKSGSYTAEVTFERPKKSKAASYSLAVWVNQAGNQTPIQAVGGDL